MPSPALGAHGQSGCRCAARDYVIRAVRTEPGKSDGAALLGRCRRLFKEGVHVLLRGRCQDFLAIPPQVLPKEVKAVFYMREAGLLW